jgi:hypothetical protein
MKPLNETTVWAKEKLERDHRLAVQMMIQQQIDTVAGMMERHKELVKGPMHYNMCCGLIDQLKSHANAAFIADGHAAAPYTGGTNGTPYFQFPSETLGI